MSQNSVLESAAITAFINELKNKYDPAKYEINRRSEPSDVVVENKSNEEKFYYEIKATKSMSYFGAATFTEISQALKTPDNYWFVIAYESNNKFTFNEYRLKDIADHFTIPPIKVFFNIDVKNINKSHKHRKGTVVFNKENFDKLSQAYEECKK